MASRGAGVCLAIVMSCAIGCGYRPLHASHSSAGGMCVVGSLPQVADAAAVVALEDGARSELSAAGALGACGERRLRVELVSLRAQAEGIVEGSPGPVARAVRFTVEAEGWIETRGEERHLGLVDAWVVVAPQASVSAQAQMQSDARAQAARRAGEKLARRAMGMQ